MGKTIVMELTGAERAALEHQVGKLESVPSDPRLVRVPEEFAQAARGVEDRGDLAVATATYNRGVGHAEAAAQSNEEKDNSGTEQQTGVPREDSAP